MNVVFDVLTLVVMNIYIFPDITPCNPLKVSLRFGGSRRFLFQCRRIRPGVLLTSFFLVSCSAYSSNLNMEAPCSSEKSVNFQRTTWSYISEDRSLP
jgi:hypothetical protein